MANGKMLRGLTVKVLVDPNQNDLHPAGEGSTLALLFLLTVTG